jgi:hypothetical protein
MQTPYIPNLLKASFGPVSKTALSMLDVDSMMGTIMFYASKYKKMIVTADVKNNVVYI